MILLASKLREKMYKDHYLHDCTVYKSCDQFTALLFNMTKYTAMCMLNRHNKTCVQQINKHLQLTQTGCPKIAFLIDCLSNSTIQTPVIL